MEKVQKDLAQSVKFIEGLNLSEEDKKKFAALVLGLRHVNIQIYFYLQYFSERNNWPFAYR